MAYCPPQDYTGTPFNTVNEKNEQPEKSKEVAVLGLPPRGVIVASVEHFRRKEFSAAELESAARRSMHLQYPHHFGNYNGAFAFLNRGAGEGNFMEIPLIRSRRGTLFPHQSDIELNPDRIIYWPEINGEAIYMVLWPMHTVIPKRVVAGV